jgi:hypothetical protein
MKLVFAVQSGFMSPGTRTTDIKINLQDSQTPEHFATS